MIEEIEVDLKAARAIRHRRRRQPSACHVKRHLPPMIDHRRAGEADLADDLGPQMQRGAGILPFLEWESRPVRYDICHDIGLGGGGGSGGSGMNSLLSRSGSFMRPARQS